MKETFKMYKKMDEIEKALLIANCKKMIAMLESDTDWERNYNGYVYNPEAKEYKDRYVKQPYNVTEFKHCARELRRCSNRLEKSFTYKDR